MRYAIDSSRLQQTLGWAPSLTFEKGLEKTVEWYLDHEEWLGHVVSGDYARYYENQYLNR
jgi:dTDP-glucose 4,6-dehydratase